MGEMVQLRVLYPLDVVCFMIKVGSPLVKLCQPQQD